MTDSAPPRQITDGHLRWRSRRGMLELELALQPFVERRLLDLTAIDRARFARLLEHDDWDIFEWLQGRQAVPDSELAELIADIRAAHGGF